MSAFADRLAAADPNGALAAMFADALRGREEIRTRGPDIIMAFLVNIAAIVKAQGQGIDDWQAAARIIGDELKRLLDVPLSRRPLRERRLIIPVRAN